MRAVFISGVLMITLWLLIVDQQRQTLLARAAPEVEDSEEVRLAAILQARLEVEMGLTAEEALTWMNMLEGSEKIPVSRLLDQNKISRDNCSLEKLRERYQFRQEAIYELDRQMEVVMNFLDDRYDKQLECCMQMWAEKSVDELLKSVTKPSHRLNLEKFRMWVKFYEHQKLIEMGPLHSGEIYSLSEGKYDEVETNRHLGWLRSKATTKHSVDIKLRKSCEDAIGDLHELVEFLGEFEAGKQSLRLKPKIDSRLIPYRETHDYCAKLLSYRLEEEEDYNVNYDKLDIDLDNMPNNFAEMPSFDLDQSII